MGVGAFIVERGQVKLLIVTEISRKQMKLFDMIQVNSKKE